MSPDGAHWSVAGFQPFVSVVSAYTSLPPRTAASSLSTTFLLARDAVPSLPAPEALELRPHDASAIAPSITIVIATAKGRLVRARVGSACCMTFHLSGSRSDSGCH